MFSLQTTDLRALAQQLSAACQFPVQCVGSIASSNDALLAQAAQLPQHPQPACALLALHQTAGRGRRGRVWQSGGGGVQGFAQGLDCTVPSATAQTVSPPLPLPLPLPEPVQPAFLASMGVRSTTPAAAVSVLPLRLGMAVAALLRQWGCAAQLKWPNDVQIETAQGTAKLGGILVESRSMAGGGIALVMGLGLNWHSAPALVDRRASHVLASASHAPAPAAAAAALLGAMQQAWQDTAASAVLKPQEYAVYDALYEHPVTAQIGNHAPIHGIAKGINAQGHLGFLGEQGLAWLSSGEVTVRVAA
jgi:BirA family transcriptional regulator, biotin operon repressor / biotin---[acetyl-CoA-carboxylase] ligase